MSSNASENFLIRTEQNIRKRNISIKNAIKKYFHNSAKIKEVPRDFECECSDPECGKHVKISIETYEKMHQRKDRFAIAKGHETPAVEKIVAKKPDYQIVEKHKLDP